MLRYDYSAKFASTIPSLSQSMCKKIFFFAGLLFACLFSAAQAQKLQLSLEGGLQHSWIPDDAERAPINYCPPGSGFCGYTSSASINFAYKEAPAGYLKGLLLYSVNSMVQLRKGDYLIPLSPPAGSW
jgi:hypothetical protein